jgi:hypothetical protein
MPLTGAWVDPTTEKDNICGPNLSTTAKAVSIMLCEIGTSSFPAEWASVLHVNDKNASIYKDVHGGRCFCPHFSGLGLFWGLNQAYHCCFGCIWLKGSVHKKFSVIYLNFCWHWWRWHRCGWHQWQIMGTISDCLQLKVNLMKKIYLYVHSTTQRCLNKIFKTFQIGDFFTFATSVSETGGAPRTAHISKNFSKKMKRP